MDILNILLMNLITIPILCFIVGIGFGAYRISWLFRPKIHSMLTCILLLLIGLKGGVAFSQNSVAPQFFTLFGILIVWGLIQPFISFWILTKFTKIDAPTAAAISACFGSVSVMTFASGTAFLEKLQVPYQTVVIAMLAIMEVPAILSGLFISKSRNMPAGDKTKNLWIHTLFNKSILLIFLGMAIGMIFDRLHFASLTNHILFLFRPLLCLFLFNMGMIIGKERSGLYQFSWSLSLFGIYMPLIGGMFGILLSYLFGLDSGTATMIAILSASASYIAVPAAVRIAIPQANEAVYLPLSLGIAFPFNVIIGIPIYYILSINLLN